MAQQTGEAPLPHPGSAGFPSPGQPGPSTARESEVDSLKEDVPSSDPSPADKPGEVASDSQQSATALEAQGERRETRPSSEPAAAEEEEKEEEGGPVMSFLEHLEALRWTLIKSIAALLVAMVLCLVAANRLVDLLLYPLKKAEKFMVPQEQVLVLKLGTNLLWRLKRDEKLPWPVPPSGEAVETYRLVPVPAGSNYVFALEQVPAEKEDVQPGSVVVKNYGPIDPFSVALQIALYGGLGLASPFILLFVGQFVVPALRKKEKKYLYRALGIGTALFLVGAAFCYLVIMQVALFAAVQFSRWMNFGADEWRAQEYISFVCKFMLGMGLAFELPVVLLTLVKIDLLDYERLNKFRAYWVVVNLIISAGLAPDLLSMFLMALPLQLLYELSVLIARYWKKKETQAAQS